MLLIEVLNKHDFTVITSWPRLTLLILLFLNTEVAKVFDTLQHHLFFMVVFSRGGRVALDNIKCLHARDLAS